MSPTASCEISTGVTTIMSLSDMVGSILTPDIVMKCTEPVGTITPISGMMIMMNSIVEIVFKIFMSCFLV